MQKTQRVSKLDKVRDRAAENDTYARNEGPTIKKKWTDKDIRSFKAANDRQKDALQAWFSGIDLALVGSAGTGKTLLAMYLAVSAVLSPKDEQQKIVIVRSAVQGREVGHLPGSLEEKLAAFESPYMVALERLFGRASTYPDMKAAGLINFVSTSFLRGMTWDNTVVVFDEAQNCTFEEINTVMTRLGEGSRIIVIGDTKQVDLKEKRHHEISGLEAMCAIVAEMGGVETVHFNKHDIVRSGFVKRWISAAEDYQEGRTGTNG